MKHRQIEEECHEWFEDVARLADKIGATVSGPRITSVNPESHYRVNIAIPFIDHSLEKNEFNIQRRQQGWGRIFFPWSRLPW